MRIDSHGEPWERVALLACLMLVPLMGCGNDVAPTSHGGIVSTAPSTTEFLFALGQGGRVVAVSDFCTWPTEAVDLPKIGGLYNIDLEAITQLQPDLIVLRGKNEKLETLANRMGFRIFHDAMDSISSIDAGISALGEELGCAPEAERLRTAMREALDAVRGAIAGESRPKVLIITGRSAHHLNTLFTVGATSFLSELAAIAGGDNIFSDASQAYLEASKEAVVTKAPDVIIEFHAGEALSDADVAAYKADWTALPSLPAVRNDRVYILTEDFYLIPGPRVVRTAHDIAVCLHPNVTLPDPVL